MANPFASPQDADKWPGLIEVEDDDPRYLEFIKPPMNVLVVHSANLQGFIQLASTQKAALTERISTLNDAIEMMMATHEEVTELPISLAQLKLWKAYAVLVGRVTTQAGWPADITWPAQPVKGMGLSFSTIDPETA